MASNVRTEEDIINDLTNYIASRKRNRPSVLAPIKREARTKRICDLVFSNPKTFKLATEIKYVPMDCLTEDILLKLVLADPENITLLSDDMLTIPVMVAYEFSKRRFEHLSSIEWGKYAVRFKEPQKIHEVRDDISNLCDELALKYNDEDTLRDYELYVNKVSEYIGNFFKEKELFELEKIDKVKVKYEAVDVATEKRVLVLISGEPDSGKSLFGRMLSSRIKNSVAFDSDQLAERGRELEPLRNLVNPKTHVVIFSDPNAHIFFSERDRNEYDVVNIVIVPSSIEKMYRRSKYKQKATYDEYVAWELKNPFGEGIYRDITVTNEYDERLWLEVDKVLEDMSLLLDFPLPPVDDEKRLEK